MNEERRRILTLLAEGKITADEAERLLAALDRSPEPVGGAPVATRSPRYLRVEVDAHESRDSPTRVNVRVPMNFLRAGVRLAALIPGEARDKVNAAMTRNGIPFDIGQLKPENLDALIEQLGEFTVDVNDKDAKVRVFCE
jgi:hypothetical protein